MENRDISYREIRNQRPHSSYIDGDHRYTKANGEPLLGRRSHELYENNDKENLSSELTVNGHRNTRDPTMHAVSGRKPFAADSTNDRGFFARLSIEEKAKHVNAGSSDYVREAVTSGDGEAPYNSFRSRSTSKSDGQSDARKAAKQMYAEFSYTPHKRAVDSYTPPLGSTDGLAPRRRDHDIRVIPKKTQSASVTELKGMFDNQSQTERASGQSRLHRPSTSESALKRFGSHDVLPKDNLHTVKAPSHREIQSDRDELKSVSPEDLGDRKARFQQAEARFKGERKGPPPPVNLKELIKKDTPDNSERTKHALPTKQVPIVPPKPSLKRDSGVFEKESDVISGKAVEASFPDNSGLSNVSSRHGAAATNKSLPSETLVKDSRYEKVRSLTDPPSMFEHGTEFVRTRSDASTDKRGAIRFVERRYSASSGSQEGDVHERRRKMPPKRASSTEFQGFEESVEVYGKKPIDINAILGLSAPEEKIDEEQEETKEEQKKTEEEQGKIEGEQEETEEMKGTCKNEGNLENMKNDHISQPEIIKEATTDVKDLNVNTQKIKPEVEFTDNSGASSKEVDVIDIKKESDRDIGIIPKFGGRKPNHIALKEKPWSSDASTKHTYRKRQNSMEKREQFLLNQVSSKTEKEEQLPASSVVKEETYIKDQVEESGTGITKVQLIKGEDLAHSLEDTAPSGEEMIEEVLLSTSVVQAEEAPFDFAKLENEERMTNIVEVDNLLDKDSDDVRKPEDSKNDEDANLLPNGFQEKEVGNKTVSGTKESSTIMGENEETTDNVGKPFIEVQEVDTLPKNPEVKVNTNQDAVEDKEGAIADTLQIDTNAGVAPVLRRERSLELPLDEVGICHEGKRRSLSLTSTEDRHVVPDREDETVENEPSGMEFEESEEEYDEDNYAEDIELPPPPERSCLKKSNEGKEKRSVQIEEKPSSVIFTYGPLEYDRGNPEIDPVSASAEWELEKRVENMDTFSVDLDKEERGLGLSIIGLGVGTENGVEKLGIFVKSLTDGGSAQKDGRIQVKDQILEVNGTSLVGVTQHFAAKTLKQTRGCVRFLMGRDKAPRHYTYDPEYGDYYQMVKELEQNHNQEMGELLRRYHDADDRAAQAEETLEAVRVELCEAEERAHKAEADMEEIKTELNFLKNKPQENKKNEKIDQLQKLLQEISEKLAASEGRLSQLHEENITKQGELQQLKDKLKQTEKDHKTSVTQNEKLTEIIQERNKQISQSEEELRSTKTELDDTLRSTKTKEAQNKKFQQELDIQKATSHELKVKLSTLEKKEEEHLIEVKRLKMEKDAITNGVRDRDEQLRKLSEERARLKQHVQELEAGEERYLDRIRILEEKLQGLTKQSEEHVKVEQPHSDLKQQVKEMCTTAVESKSESPNIIAAEDIVVDFKLSPIESAAEVQVEIDESDGRALEIVPVFSEVAVLSESRPSGALLDEMKPGKSDPFAAEVEIELPKQENSAPEEKILTIENEVKSLSNEDKTTHNETGLLKEKLKDEKEPPCPVEELPSSEQPTAEKQENDVNPIPKPPRQEAFVGVGKLTEGKGGLIEFKYKPGGPFFPDFSDLSDMPETLVDSPSDSGSEDDFTSTEGKDKRTEVRKDILDVTETETATDEPVDEKKILIDGDKIAHEEKDISDGDLDEQGVDRSSFLETLRENPSFKAWLDEEWNIVSEKIKEEEAEKIAEQVIQASSLPPERSDQEVDIVYRSGSAKLDETYLKRTIVEQDSVDVRPVLLTQESEERIFDKDDEVLQVIAEEEKRADVEDGEAWEPVNFQVPDTTLLDTSPQLEKLRVARERSHRRPSSKKNAISDVNLEKLVILSNEKDTDEENTKPEAVEEKKGRKVAEVQPMLGNPMLFKELAAATAARPNSKRDNFLEENKIIPQKENASPEPQIEKTGEREQPVAEADEPIPITLESHRDHRIRQDKHKFLGIKLPKLSFGSKRKSQDFLNLDVTTEDTESKNWSPVLLSRKKIADQSVEDTTDGVVPFDSKQHQDTERQPDSISTDEAVVPFAEKVAADNGSPEHSASPAEKSSSDAAPGSAASQSSSVVVSPIHHKSQDLNFGSQDSLDEVGSETEDTDMANRSFSSLEWMQKSVNEWDTRQVGILMAGMSMGQYVDTFQKRGVNGPEFITLNGSKLKELGVANVDHRAVIKKKVKELKALEKEKNKKEPKRGNKGKDGRQSKWISKGKYPLK